LTIVFILAILALGLNVVVGYSGLLQLGIAAFFGIGAYITGILTVKTLPFQVGFFPALVLSTVGAGLLGVVLGAPTLRLRGAGLAGGLYATNLTSTAGPGAFDFHRSIIMICCVILGGLGSIRGTLLGVLLLISFDNTLTPILDSFIQWAGINPGGSRFLSFSS